MRLFLYLLLITPLLATAQIKDLYDLDNSYHEIYKKAQVKSLEVTTTEYGDGEVVLEYVELKQKMDREGNIVYEREYMDDDPNDGWEIFYTYNTSHQTVQMDWTWIEDGEKERTTYVYDDDGKVISSCNYIKAPSSSMYRPDFCENYLYDNGRLVRIVSDGELQYTFAEVDGQTHRLNTDGETEGIYENGHMVYIRYDVSLLTGKKGDYNYFGFKNNKLGQTLESWEMDAEGNQLDKTIFEYKDDLLVKVTHYNSDNKPEYIDRYVYSYYE